MKFEPCNRRLLIEKTSAPTRLESFIATPDSYRDEERHVKVKVLAISPDVRPPLSPEQEIIVLAHMIEEVDFGEGKLYLVLENHVVGILKGR